MFIGGDDYKGSQSVDTSISVRLVEVTQSRRQAALVLRLDIGPWTLDYLFKVTIVSDDLPGEEHVLYPRSGADVMHYQAVLVRFRPEVGENSDVLDAVTKLPGHHITG